MISSRRFLTGNGRLTDFPRTSRAKHSDSLEPAEEEFKEAWERVLKKESIERTRRFANSKEGEAA